MGGSVSDPEHRDAGSLLTLTVLLSPPEDYSSAELLFSAGGEAGGGLEPLRLRRGDGALFPSEKRHNVTPLTAGCRRSFVLEFWAGGANVYNRHR